jgi:hypothetical protein
MVMLSSVVVASLYRTRTPAAAFIAGTAVAGVGFGLAFQGAFRMILNVAAPSRRAGLLLFFPLSTKRRNRAQ